MIIITPNTIYYSDSELFYYGNMLTATLFLV